MLIIVFMTQLQKIRICKKNLFGEILLESSIIKESHFYPPSYKNLVRGDTYNIINYIAIPVSRSTLFVILPSALCFLPTLKSHDRESRNIFPLSFMKDQVSLRTSLLSNLVPPLHPFGWKGKSIPAPTLKF